MTRIGGFLITYNRPQVVVDTITKLESQTIPLEVIWVIDNSTNNETKESICALNNKKIRYYRVGYNAGPAGGAKIGLRECLKENVDWIYWGDDNDPPIFPDSLERLIREVSKEAAKCSIGIIGTVGHFFDNNLGVIKKTPSHLLLGNGLLEVDCIAGNMTMMVNKRVLEAGVYPDPDLFFGFEELDFCLQVKKQGFGIYVDKAQYRELRKHFNKTDTNRSIYKKKTFNSLPREYYSVRNLLFIASTNGYKEMKTRLIIKCMAKSLFGFRYGIKYGTKNAKYVLMGLFHFLIDKKGETMTLKNGH
ncbi:glycosyltransferase [Echinicola sp. CAU 1574]|uniref:Glycosyltransferase n=1 Tax=Echinicola arenosa TaxID=2774144 RepID=A0ABR9ARE2_9BACT|nr:glycosyltransferase [Echinicola arenosa]MBD8490443.1 glycosyltransferase [Echinicola arenosa]